jgi:hypothetical protein
MKTDNEVHNEKKTWSNPKLFHLDFKETKTGNFPGPAEDVEYDQFNSYSPQ